MDINNYSYAPYMLDDLPTAYHKHNKTTIENRGTHFVVWGETEEWNKFFSLEEALSFARELMTSGG